MAPTNGATGKTSQAGVRRPPGGPYKPVVPVIPLPYLRRQNKAPSAAAHPQQAVPPLKQVEGDSTGHHSQDGDQTKETKMEANRDQAPTEQQSKNPDPTALPPTSTITPKAASAMTSAAASADVATTTTERAASPPTAPSSQKGLDTPPSQSSTAYVHEQVASPTPTRRRVPPPFHTVNGASNNLNHNHHHTSQPSIGSFHGAGPMHSRFPSLNQTRLHQAHPSNGSMIFGGFNDSNGSSPAPHSGGFNQPPNAISMPYPGAPALDEFGRPMFVSPAVDGFPPVGLQHPLQHHQYHHAPPTPHSFHGSQSSIQADENSYSAYLLHSGHSAYPVQTLGQPPPQVHALDPQSGGRFNLAGTSDPACVVSRIQMQTFDFLRGGIQNGEFSDCTLELRLIHADYSRQHRAPLVVPCHRFIISQSPRLKHLLRTRDSSADQRLVIELQDQYMRYDAFDFTLRTLYGWDLGDGPLPAYRAPQGLKDAFDLSLGYAAAASYLFLPLAHAKAIRYACHQLHWDTIERACQFALPSAIFPRPTRQDGASSSDALTASELLDAIVAFLVHNLPSDFVLNVDAGDCGFSRLPLASTPVLSSRNMPAIVHGSSRPGQEPLTPHSRHGSMGQAQMPRTSRSSNPRLSTIQFGDLSLNGNGNGTSPGGYSDSSSTARQPRPVDTILSRILLNLPFPMLKQILEHPALAKPSGELSIPKRHRLIASIVGEREARRARALDKMDPQLQVFVEKLESTAEPLVVQQMGDFLVNNMGYKEEVFPGDVPYLVQTWIHGSDSIST